MAAPPYNALAQQAFDLTRDVVLSYPMPTIQVADIHSLSTTHSTYRLHWNTLEEWRDFGDLVIAYWNTVPQTDKTSMVFASGEFSGRYQRVSSALFAAANEGMVRNLHGEFVIPVQNNAANGINNAPLPSDRHSRLQQWDQGVEANALAGMPDCVMASDFGHPGYLRRITAMIEIKNPWQVTPALVDQVIWSIQSPIPSLVLT